MNVKGIEVGSRSLRKWSSCSLQRTWIL